MSHPPEIGTATACRPQYVVAMETSSRHGSICIAKGGQVLAEAQFSPGNRHASELMPALAKLCRGQNCDPSQVAQIHVSVGPGSFTGIRIAISVARALHLATGAALVAVPTLHVIARNAPAEAQHLLVILDAKRGQVFAAEFKRCGSDWILIRGPRLIEPGVAIREAQAEGGGDAAPLHIMGEGIDYHRAAIGEVGGVVEVDKALWVPSARAVFELGWQKAAAGEFAPPTELLPVYIRLAEAEEVWRKKRGLAI